MTENILVVLTDGKGANACLTAADTAVEAIPGAGIKVLHVRVDPMSTILPSEEVMSDERHAELDRLADEESAVVHAAFDAWQAKRKDASRVKWREVIGTEDEACTTFGKMASLIVIAKPGAQAVKHAREAFHAVLFETERPILMVPPDLSGDFGRRMLVGWKDSETTREAIAAALPWLRKAEKILVAQVCETGVGKFEEARKLFEQHGISAEFAEIAANDESVGVRLLDEANARGFDCLVMGAYRHNRLVELVLGGATADVLDQAEIPVFLRH